MTKREELRARIEELEDKRFYLAMADRWTDKDYELDWKWFTEVNKLKKELAEM